jgi:hypothetical protein
MVRFLTYSAAAITAFLMLTVALWFGMTALISVVAVTGVVIYLVRRYSGDSDFLTTIFIGTRFVRVFFGLVVKIYEPRKFKSDSLRWDLRADRVVDLSMGLNPDLTETRGTL